MTRRSSPIPAVFFTSLLVLAIFTSLLTQAQSSSRHSPHAQIKGRGGGEGKGTQWPCCDNCGGCTKSIPPQCRCMDVVRRCHPACNDCVKSSLSVDPPMYQCMDRIANFCKHRCTTATH